MTPASDRKPMIGDRVWLKNEGKHYEGKVYYLADAMLAEREKR